MKFLLNVNITPRLKPLLEKEGHSCRHAARVGHAKASDTQIINIARKNDEVIITHDLDYGRLLAFTNHKKPAVIIFRIHRINADIFYQFLKDYWEAIREYIERGAVVVFERGNVRIRTLPIR